MAGVQHSMCELAWHGRCATRHVWISTARQGCGMGTAWYVWISLLGVFLLSAFCSCCSPVKWQTSRNRVCIKVCCNLQKTAPETFEMLKITFCDDMIVSQTFECYSCFTHGQSSSWGFWTFRWPIGNLDWWKCGNSELSSMSGQTAYN